MHDVPYVSMTPRAIVRVDRVPSPTASHPSNASRRPRTRHILLHRTFCHCYRPLCRNAATSSPPTSRPCPMPRKRSNAPAYYAVAIGRQRGVFTTWDDAKNAVDGVGGAKHKVRACRDGGDDV